MAVTTSDWGGTIVHDEGGSRYSRVHSRHVGKERSATEMSYEQFGTPLDSPDPSMIPSGYPPYDVSGRQGPPSMGGDPNWQIQRSLSTPDASGLLQSSDPSAPGSSSEKKRNKLGYHRTSVACSHCRRRKIRCIPSPSDSQGRCANCIRLKKECSFIPTEQQQGADPRHRGSGQLSVDSEPPSEPSSPGLVDSTSRRPSPVSYQSMGGRLPAMGPGTMGESAGIGSIGSSGASYDLEHNVTTWMPLGTTQQFVGGGTSMTWTDPWQTQPMESPVADPNAGPRPSTTWTPGAPDAAPRDMAWGQMQPPGRSFSYSGESMSSQGAAQYVPVSHAGQPGVSAASPFPNVPVSMANMGEGYQTPSMNPSVAPIHPGGIPSQGQMQWMSHQGGHPSRGPYGAPWLQGGEPPRQE